MIRRTLSAQQWEILSTVAAEAGLKIDLQTLQRDGTTLGGDIVEQLLGALLDALVRSGLELDDEPNARGHLIEDVIDYLNAPRTGSG